MSEWTDIIDGIADHVALLKELGERTVEIDLAVMQSLTAKGKTPSTPQNASVHAASGPPASPTDRTGEPPQSQRRPPVAVTAPPTPGNTPARSPEERRKALDEIAVRIDACSACVLRQQRAHSVPGQGNGNSPDVMFIGEAPGAEEDQQGLAFVGAAGQLLTKMINAMGYARDDVFIANICKCRPPKNRTPQSDEMQTCLPFLREQIRIIRPKTIVLLGGTALKGLLDTQVGITRMQGQWSRYEGIPVMPTFHPAYVLRFESYGDMASLKKAKTEVWHALKLVLAQLGKPVPTPSAAK